MKPKYKKYILMIAASIAATIVFMAYVTGPPAGVTNAPGETTCYSSPACHAGAPDNGPGFGEITIMGGIPQGNLYVPGSTYVMMPYVVDTAMQKSGFQIVARLLNGNNAGTSTITQPNSTQLISGGGYDYVEQTQAGAHQPTMANMHDWMYDWQAPGQGSGTVVFYAAFLAADGDGGNTGDRIYTDTLVLYEDTTIGIKENKHAFGEMKIFPAPATDDVYLEWPIRLQTPTQLSLFDTGGNRVIPIQTIPPGSLRYHLHLNGLAAGVYLVRLNCNGMMYYQKIVKM